MSRDFDSHLLRTFITVTEAGSLSEAAIRLHRTQAAVSMALQRLEEDVGQQLMERTPRGVKLTPAGSILLPYAYRILGSGNEARTALHSAGQAIPLKIGMPEEIASGYLLGTLQQFSTSCPEIPLDILIDSSRTLSQLLNNGEMDIIIGDPSLILAEPVFRWKEKLCWAAAQCNDRSPVTSPLPLVLFSGECVWQNQLFIALLSQGIPWKVVCSSTSLSAILTAVEAGLGITVLPAFNIGKRKIEVPGPGESRLPVLPWADFALYCGQRLQSDSSARETLQAFLLKSLQSVGNMGA